MFHNSLVTGDSINCFYHPGISMSQQVCDLCGGKICLLELCAVSGPPVVIIIEFIDPKCLESIPVRASKCSVVARLFRIPTMNYIPMLLLERSQNFVQSIWYDEITSRMFCFCFFTNDGLFLIQINNDLAHFAEVFVQVYIFPA